MSPPALLTAPHGDAEASQFRHATAGLPLGLAPNVAVKPEAVLLPSNDCERVVELFCGNEIGTMRQERALFKTERVNRAETVRWYFGVTKTQFRLHAIGHRRIDLGEFRPKESRELFHYGFFVFRTRFRHGVERRRWGGV